MPPLPGLPEFCRSLGNASPQKAIPWLQAQQLLDYSSIRRLGTSAFAEAKFGPERSKISPVSCFSQHPPVELWCWIPISPVSSPGTDEATVCTSGCCLNTAVRSEQQGLISKACFCWAGTSLGALCQRRLPPSYRKALKCILPWDLGSSAEVHKSSFFTFLDTRMSVPDQQHGMWGHREWLHAAPHPVGLSI